MIDDKTAKMATNTIRAYCDEKECDACAIFDACRQTNGGLRDLSIYFSVGTFEDLQKSAEKPPKFDIRQKDSADFQNYINEIFLREAEKYGLPMSTANSIKWSENGEIKVTFVDDDNKMNYLGRAKCHPDDAFNPEIGIKLAVERAAQAMHAPFVPAENETYYYVDDEDTICSTINYNTNRDILNISVGNCFKNYERALSNKGAITKRIERAKALLKSLREDDANAMGRCK